MDRPNRSAPILFRRAGDGPILTARDWPYDVHAVFNAGAVRLPSGETLLLVRAEDRTGRSHLCAARSNDGITRWRIDPRPTLEPDPPSHPEDLWGIEDPRLTWLPELGACAVAFTSYGPGGPGVSLALTEDFRRFDRLGLVLPPDNKDAAVFPRRLGGKWMMFHRPYTSFGGHVWLSSSPDLRAWGEHRLVMHARAGGWWDSSKIGLSCPPLATDEGWLLLYHGVRVTASGSIYRLGLALFDLDNPAVCLRRGRSWILGPEHPHERVGDVGNVVFPCGWTLGDDGDTVHLYYGAADTSMALATASLRALLEHLRRDGETESATGATPF